MRIFLILLILTASCQGAKYIHNGRLIQGNWCLVQTSEFNEINYGKIELSEDLRIVLLSRADTIYSYRYKVEKDDLLIIKEKNDTIVNHILKLTADSLILVSLLEKPKKQVYYRCK